MNARTHPLEQAERLGRPLALSAFFHCALFATALVWSALNAPIRLGDPGGQIGGAVPVNIVQGVALPTSRSNLENPVANPVQHDVPAIPSPPKATPQPKVSEDDPGAVPIETKAKKRPRKTARRNIPPQPKNQLGSSTGAAVSSPIYSGQPGTSGSGGVDFGSGSPFGARFGWYANALQRRLAEEWRKTLGQVEGASSKPVVVSFRIRGGGRVDDVRIVQSSGNRSLDYSSLRAVVNSSPMPTLPRGLGRSSIYVEMWFHLKL